MHSSCLLSHAHLFWPCLYWQVLSPLTRSVRLCNMKIYKCPIHSSLLTSIAHVAIECLSVVRILSANTSQNDYFTKINIETGMGLQARACTLNHKPTHYCVVIMNAMASQITGVSIVYSTVCADADPKNIKPPRYWPFVRGIHRWPVDSPHKGPVTWKLFPLDDVIMTIRCMGYTNVSLLEMLYEVLSIMIFLIKSHD